MAVMTPSELNSIISGQIGKIQDLLGAALRKAGLRTEPTQQVIELQGELLAVELIAVVRKRVEAVSEMIVRHVVVNRSRSPEEALKATARVQYVTDNVVKAMPKGECEKVNVFFFKLGRHVSDTDLDKDYEWRGFKPVDPYVLAAVNEADPVFADGHPNGTHWKDADGKWCFAVFNRRFDERSVSVERIESVERIDNEWDHYWWFAGCRK